MLQDVQQLMNLMKAMEEKNVRCEKLEGGEEGGGWGGGGGVGWEFELRTASNLEETTW
jgi:hypothetical protein